VAREDPSACAKCGSKNIRRDDDVLDTWFSSALWPFSTLGWPKKTPELEYYYPTDVLVTDRGIIYLWVARMVMDGLLFMNETPFHDVFINPTVVDEQGRRMSKSLGNGIDPVEMIDKYGTDAVRFSLMMLTVEQQDARLSEKKFELGRHFANKVWNASRFVMMNLGGAPGTPPIDAASKLALEDKWILSRLGSAVHRCTDALSNYRLNEAATTVYDFTWREFCDWYVEIVKPRLQKKDEDGTVARAVLIHCLDTLMRLLHPFAPFISEEIWQKVRPMLPASLTRWEHAAPASLMIAAWPDSARHPIDGAAERTMAILQGVIRSVRDVRSKMNIPDSQPLELVASGSEEVCAPLRQHAVMLKSLAGIEKLAAGPGLAKPEGASSDVVEGVQLFIPLKGVIDIEQERGRLQRRIEEAAKALAGSEAKLKNESFAARAPAEVVAAERERHAQLRERLSKLKTSLEELG
jgi:valyl-tRNA synthetase